MRKVLILYNPIAGKGKSLAAAALFNETAKQYAQWQYYTATTNAAADFTEIINLIESQNISHVVIIGGDGTVNQVVGALEHLNLIFAIIPMGSGNGLSYAANIPINTSKAIELFFSDTVPKLTDKYKANNKVACMLCGLGFDAAIAENFAQSKTRGLGTYAKITLSHFFKAKSYPFTLHIGQQSIDVDAYMICVANSNQFGNKFTIAPKALLDDGLLDVVIISKTSKLKFIWNTLNQLLGRNQLSSVENLSVNQSIIYFQVAGVSIHNMHLAPLHIDGEAVTTEKEITFSVSHKQFLLIRP
jgi:diacylglycerol kinase (ATP)